MILFRVLLIVLALWVVGVALLGLYRRAVAAGWLYGPGQAPRRANTVGSLGFEQVFEPSMEYVFEERERLAIEADHQNPGDQRDESFEEESE